MQVTKTQSFTFSRSLLILFSLVIISGCKKKEEEKQPSADFSFDKTEYLEGETINLINKSSDAKTYRWTMPDGQTSKNENLSYVAETFFSDRTAQFKLEAISESGLKTDYAVKNIPIKAGKGRLVIFYVSLSEEWSINATIDGIIYPITLQPTTQEPNCGENNHPTFDLKTGVHKVIVTSGSFTFWSGDITIVNGQCFKLDIKP